MQPRVLFFSLNMLRFPFLYSYCLNVSFHFDDKKEEKDIKRQAIGLAKQFGFRCYSPPSPFAFLYPYYPYIFVHWQDFPNPSDFFMINDIKKPIDIKEL